MFPPRVRLAGRTGLLNCNMHSHFGHPRVKPSNIYVDAVSMTLLKGSTIDFATELIGSSFRVLDNPQVSLVCCLPPPYRLPPPCFITPRELNQRCR